MLLQNGPGMLVHNEAKLLYGHLLGVSLIRLEQVVIQIFRNLDSGSDIVTIRRKDNCLEFGKFSLFAQLLEAFGQLVQSMDIVAGHVFQKRRHRTVLHLEDHFRPGGASASLQHGVQPFLRGWQIQAHHVIRLLIGVEGIPADRQADAVFRRFGNQGQAVIYLLQLSVLRDIPAACENAALLKPGFSSEHLKVKILEDGIRNFFQGRDEIVLRIEPAELFVRRGVDHMTAVCAVGQVDHGGNADGTVFFGHLHVEQPFEGRSFSAVHLSQAGCQRIELIQIAFMGQMDMEELKTMVFKEFPPRLVAQCHLELVQCVRKAIVGSRKLQIAPPIRFSAEQLHTEHFIQGSSLPFGACSPPHIWRDRHRGHPSHTYCPLP